MHPRSPRLGSGRIRFLVAAVSNTESVPICGSKGEYDNPSCLDSSSYFCSSNKADSDGFITSLDLLLLTWEIRSIVSPGVLNRD
jgi:hypothetical protein